MPHHRNSYLPLPQSPQLFRGRGITLVEVLVVIGVIAALLGVLFPALANARRSSQMTVSMNNLRQISTFMRLYSEEYRDAVLASQWNHEGNQWIGHPRCLPSLGEWHARGTWTDILWTHYDLGIVTQAEATLGHNYRFDSPDGPLYELLGDDLTNILRAAAPNSRDVKDGTAPRPFGTGAQEQNLPGFFAANNFFNDDPLTDTFNGDFTNGQIKQPARSMYLVDSFAGETIEDDPTPWNTALGTADAPSTLEVDFRYTGNALMLFLDGHSQTISPWTGLEDLQKKRQIRIQNLAGGVGGAGGA